jgi:hypothetical protein
VDLVHRGPLNATQRRWCPQNEEYRYPSGLEVQQRPRHTWPAQLGVPAHQIGTRSGDRQFQLRPIRDAGTRLTCLADVAGRGSGQSAHNQGFNPTSSTAAECWSSGWFRHQFPGREER